MVPCFCDNNSSVKIYEYLNTEDEKSRYRAIFKSAHEEMRNRIAGEVIKSTRSTSTSSTNLLVSGTVLFKYEREAVIEFLEEHSDMQHFQTKKVQGEWRILLEKVQQRKHITCSDSQYKMA